MWGSVLAVALLLHVTGITWPQIRLKAGPQLVSLLNHLSGNPRYRDVAVILIVGYFVETRHDPQYKDAVMTLAGGYFVVTGLGYVRSLRRDIDMYVMPRTISDRQSDHLQNYLSRRDRHAVTVKVNPRDSEAREYAARIFNALRQTAWDVDFSTFDGPPHCNNDGLSIVVIGSNAGPPDPKRDPAPLLQAALRSARIEVNGGGSVGAGTYKLFILVGHRPLVIGYKGSAISRFGRFLQKMG